MKRTGTTSSHHAGRAARRWLLGALALGMASAAVAVAQYQVNRQIYGNTSSSVRYGRSYQPDYANHPTNHLLPSESRNLMWRSGALPSTIRMNHAAVGPLAPAGVAAYVPEPQNFRSSAVSSGNYVNTIAPARVTPMPAVGAAPAPRTGAPAPAMPANPAAAGSMRYATPSAGSGAPTFLSMSSAAPAPVSYSQMVSGTAPAVWTPQSGSIKYSR